MTLDTVHVLLAEDDFGDRVIVERALELCPQPFALTHRGTLGDTLQCLAEDRFDVVLLDLSLPDSFGLASLEKISACEIDIPVVVLTGLEDDQLSLQAIEQGAQDYLVKGSFDERLLERTLRYSIQRHQIQAENRRLMSDLQQMARTDSLTGVLNRVAFNEELETVFKSAVRYQRPLSCIVLDIDFFKRINDTWGHLAGDRVLRGVAQCLVDTCRESDLIGRLGGEEFCIGAPETSEHEAVELAERIQSRLTKCKFDLPEIRPTASFGVCEWNLDTVQAHALIDSADQAMFIAKHRGRNQIVSNRQLRISDEPTTDPSLDVEAGIVMRPVVETALDTEGIGAVLDRMVVNQLESIAIFNERSELVGVVDRQLMLSSAMANRLSESTPVRELMRSNPVTFSENTRLGEIVQFLCRSNLVHVFVTGETAPLGMLSQQDILAWIRENRPENETTEQPDQPAETV